MRASLAFNGARQWRRSARKRFAPLLKAPKGKSIKTHGCAIKRQWRALMAQASAARRLISRFKALPAQWRSGNGGSRMTSEATPAFRSRLVDLPGVCWFGSPRPRTAQRQTVGISTVDWSR